MSEIRKRQRAIRFRVTGGEEERIRAAAKQVGISLANFARDAALAAAAGEAAPIRDSKARDLRDVLAEIHRIGALTRKRAIKSDDADRLQFELRRLQRLLFRFYYEDAAE